MSKERNPQFVIDGVAYWAKVYQPDDNDKYTLDVCQLSNETVEKCLEYNIPVKNGQDDKKPMPEKGNYIVARSGYAPGVVDAKKKPMTELIGNGSIVRVLISPYNWTHKTKGSGTSAGLQAVQVLELVAYDPTAVAKDMALTAFEEAEGFETSSLKGVDDNNIDLDKFGD